MNDHNGQEVEADVKNIRNDWDHKIHFLTIFGNLLKERPMLWLERIKRPPERRRELWNEVAVLLRNALQDPSITDEFVRHKYRGNADSWLRTYKRLQKGEQVSGFDKIRYDLWIFLEENQESKTKIFKAKPKKKVQNQNKKNSRVEKVPYTNTLKRPSTEFYDEDTMENPSTSGCRIKREFSFVSVDDSGSSPTYCKPSTDSEVFDSENMDLEIESRVDPIGQENPYDPVDKVSENKNQLTDLKSKILLLDSSSVGDGPQSHVEDFLNSLDLESQPNEEPNQGSTEVQENYRKNPVAQVKKIGKGFNVHQRPSARTSKNKACQKKPGNSTSKRKSLKTSTENKIVLLTSNPIVERDKPNESSAQESLSIPSSHHSAANSVLEEPSSSHNSKKQRTVCEEFRASLLSSWSFLTRNFNESQLEELNFGVMDLLKKIKHND